MKKGIVVGPVRQTVRLDARNAFLEVCTSSFPIGKIVINTIQYDPARDVGRRTINKVSQYFAPTSAYALAKFIEDPGPNGLYQKSLMSREAAESLGQKYPDAVWRSDYGGTMISETKSVCRQLVIYPGLKSDYVVDAISGEGKITQTHGIVFDGASPTIHIRVPISHFDALKLAGGLMGAFYGFATRFYTDQIARTEKEDDSPFEFSLDELFDEDLNSIEY